MTVSDLTPTSPRPSSSALCRGSRRSTSEDDNAALDAGVVTFLDPRHKAEDDDHEGMTRALLPAQAASDRVARDSASRRRARQGFTLVELMVVIVIIGLLATVVAINVLPSQDKAMIGKARADISTLEQAIETYRLDNLTFPDAQSGLQALTAPPAGLARPERYREGGYIRRLPEDPWGNAYQYRRPSAHGGQFDVFSYGADGKEGGEGNDADIGNWDI
jgi:general secretion pathway protein G